MALGGKTRVLMINLTAPCVPAHCFGERYHQRRRAERAYKRLRHRLHLESVTDLSQQALMFDVAAKDLAGTRTALLARGAHESADG